MKVSVIVPVYKVEPYLRRCLDSIINQTYKNLEIILVDDGSPDNCPVICDEYAARDSRVKVIHQNNGGISAARNAGLDIATGDYIAFVDSDDTIAKDMYRKMVDVVEHERADIVKCGVCEVKGSEIKKIVFPNQVYETNRLGGLLDWFHGGMRWSVVCNGLYRVDLVKDIRFPVGFIHEDNYFSPLSVFKAKKIVTVKDSYYNYHINGTGTMANRGKRPLDRVFTRSLLKKEFEKVHFCSRRLDRSIAADLYHYIRGSSCFAQPCVIQKDLLKYVFRNLDLRRSLMLRYWLWKKKVRIG